MRKKPAKAKPAIKTAKKKKKLAAKPSPKKKLAKRPAKKKQAAKAKQLHPKKTRVKAKANTSRKRARAEDLNASLESFGNEALTARTAGQSGGLQGLSHAAGADSESVEELVEEGNAFEGGVVSGVEAADRADEQEVHTHEVPEDDVPGEYLDQD